MNFSKVDAMVHSKAACGFGTQRPAKSFQGSNICSLVHAVPGTAMGLCGRGEERHGEVLVLPPLCGCFLLRLQLEWGGVGDAELVALCQAGVPIPSEGLCQDGTGAGGAVGTGLQRGQGDLPQNSVSYDDVVDPVKRMY